MKRKTYKPNDKMEGAALTHMRDVAFGSGMSVFLHQVGEKSDRMRDDAGLLAQAQAKRDRKAAKRMAAS